MPPTALANQNQVFLSSKCDAALPRRGARLKRCQEALESQRGSAESGGPRREAAVADGGPPSLKETKEKEGKRKSKHMDERSHAGSVRARKRDTSVRPKRDEAASLSPIWTEIYAE